MRKYTGALLVFSLTSCNAIQQFPLQANSNAEVRLNQQRASLCVKVNGFDARTTQAVDPSIVRIELSIQSTTKLDQPQIATLDKNTTEVVFQNLIPGAQCLIAEAWNGETNTLLDRQQLGLSLEAGTTTSVLIPLHLGGSAAIGMNLTIEAALREISSWKIPDGLDWDFQNYCNGYYSYQGGLYWLSRDGAIAPITLGSESRITGNGEHTYFERRNWHMLPAHAQYIETKPLGGHTDVRRFSWANTFRFASFGITPGGYSTYENGESVNYRVLAEILPMEADYKVDRWISARQGVLKEVLSQNGATISVLVKDGLEE